MLTIRYKNHRAFIVSEMVIVFYSYQWFSFDKVVNNDLMDKWFQDFLYCILMNWMDKIFL